MLSQEKYCKDLLKHFGMDNLSSKPTPMSISIHLDWDEIGKEVDQKLYRSMIGSLLYLTAGGPDITMSVCICAGL